jgi:uncharacterized protein
MQVRELSTGECRSLLLTATFGWLACSRENQPYIVPISFVAEADFVYSFSMLGQKLEWMRLNPLVCLAVDDIKQPDEWTSVVVSGRYEELPLAPGREIDGSHAHQLLQRRAMWWQPGAIPLAGTKGREHAEPIFYRIRIDRLTGRLGTPL